MDEKIKSKIRNSIKNPSHPLNYLTKNCLVCNNEFKTINPLKKYCSKKCKEINNYEAVKKGIEINHKGTTTNCEYCKKEIEQNIQGRKKFCSPRCKYKYKYLNHRRHQDQVKFGGNRELAFKRDNQQCVKCKCTNEDHLEKFNCYLHMHHIDWNRKNNNLNNLVTLCNDCHFEIHHPLFKLFKYTKKQNARNCLNSKGFHCNNKECINKTCPLFKEATA